MALVFVHGIGNQRQGSGTRSLAQAIFRWKEREAGDRAPTRLAAAGIEAVDTRLTGPEAAFSVLDVVTDGAQQHWLVTEAWWADCYDPPSAAATLRWLAVYAPLAIVTRCLEGVISAWHRSWNHPLQWWRIAAALLLVLLATPLSALILAVSAVATFLRAFIPIAWVRSLLDAVVRILTRVLGDSFLFTIDPVARNAMETAVAERLEETCAQADRVVVVAHSQGAAIIASLAGSRFGNLRRSGGRGATFDESLTNEGQADGGLTGASMHLVTLGPGIAQLQWLRRAKASGALLSGTLAYYLAVVAFAFFVFAVTSAALGMNQKTVVAVGMLAGWWLLPAAIFKFTRDCYNSGLAAVTPEGERLVVPGFASWTNLAATADPVSGTYDLGAMFDGVNSRAVCNHNSVFRDHTAYLANTTECVATIVELALGSNSATAAESHRTGRARRATRHRSGQLLVWSRLLIAAGALLALIGVRDRVDDYGREGLDYLPRWLLPSVETYDFPLLGTANLAPAYGLVAVLLGAGAVYLVAIGLVRVSESAPDNVKVLAACSGLAILWSAGAFVSGLGAFLHHGDTPLAVLLSWVGSAIFIWAPSAFVGWVACRSPLLKTAGDLQYWLGASAAGISALLVWVTALEGAALNLSRGAWLVTIGVAVCIGVVASALPRSRPLGQRVLVRVEQRFIGATWPRVVTRDQHIVEHTLTTLGIVGVGVQGALLLAADRVTGLWPFGFSVLISYGFSMSLFDYASKLRVCLAAIAWAFTVLVAGSSLGWF